MTSCIEFAERVDMWMRVIWGFKTVEKRWKHCRVGRRTRDRQARTSPSSCPSWLLCIDSRQASRPWQHFLCCLLLVPRVSAFVHLRKASLSHPWVYVKICFVDSLWHSRKLHYDRNGILRCHFWDFDHLPNVIDFVERFSWRSGKRDRIRLSRWVSIKRDFQYLVFPHWHFPALAIVWYLRRYQTMLNWLRNFLEIVNWGRMLQEKE